MVSISEADPTVVALQPDELAAGCQHKKTDNSHERFCFELFRRSIAERDQQCWAEIYRQYQKLVIRWTADHISPMQQIGDTTVEELVLDAFTSFWRAYTEDKLAKANGVGSVLMYLKSCVATSVAQARRKAERTIAQAEWDQFVVDSATANNNKSVRTDESVLEQIEREQLWQIVESCCHDEKDQIIARLGLVSNLKPRVISKMHPDLFANVEEIYELRRNLKNRLRRNEELKRY